MAKNGTGRDQSCMREAGAAGALPKTGRRWKRKDGGRTLWLVFRISLFVSVSRICAVVFALRICMLVAGLGRRVPPAALFPGHLRGVAFGESPGGGSTSSSPLVVFGRGETRSGGITLWFLAPVRARYPFLEVRAYGKQRTIRCFYTKMFLGETFH